jgi:hypothetical protein
LVHQTPKPRSNNNQADLKDKSSTGPSLCAVFPASSMNIGCDHCDRKRSPRAAHHDQSCCGTLTNAWSEKEADMVAATQTTEKPRQQDRIIGAEATISGENRLLLLRIALIVIGLTFIFGIYALGIVWPSGWAWGHGHSHYLMMIIGVYATLGVFLLIASSNPYAHKSLIWFTVWSSVVHAAIMGVQAVTDSAERGHLLGDVPALILVAIVLAVLAPRTAQA